MKSETGSNHVQPEWLNACQAIIFDLDGVLINSEPVHEFTLLKLSSEFGRPFTQQEILSFKGFPEKTTAHRFKEIFPDLKATEEEIIEKRLELLKKNFHLVQIMDGAIQFLRRCGAYRLGLATSADRRIQELAFRTFALDPFFEAVITGNDVRKGKPDPEPYSLAANRLGVAPQVCLVIEDAVNGVLSGKAAGCRVAGLATSFDQDVLHKAGADLVAFNFEILDTQLFGREEK
ncbi:MAG: HAD family phosphatase [Verrucomicrobia bacterium]|nr:HAD family phosphatase [Verrucomicrobiota bacterium]